MVASQRKLTEVAINDGESESHDAAAPPLADNARTAMCVPFFISPARSLAAFHGRLL